MQYEQGELGFTALAQARLAVLSAEHAAATNAAQLAALDAGASPDQLIRHSDPMSALPGEPMKRPVAEPFSNRPRPPSRAVKPLPPPPATAAVRLPASPTPATPPRPASHKMPLRARTCALRRDIIELHQGPEAARDFERRIASGEDVA